MMHEVQTDSVTAEELVSEILRVHEDLNAHSIIDRSMKIKMSDEEDEEEHETIHKTKNVPQLIILDCQDPKDYSYAHIRGAINVTFPAIMVRRIQAGKIDIFDKSKDLARMMSNTKITFVVYDSFNPNEGLSDIVSLVSKQLTQRGCNVVTLKGGLTHFHECFPEWVDSSEKAKSSNMIPHSSSSSSSNNSPGPFAEPGEVPLLGLGSLASLRIQDESDACDSSIGLDLDEFPIQIIPNLFLGNSTISSDGQALSRHNIKHILNVTPDLVNHFQDEIRYLQIPISDHWSQSLLNYFPAAITFIDEGISKEEGVLVHCLAGISRSVTITMAYLMYKRSLSLNEAYDLVRARKSNISPNFHFMGQLLDFERQIQSQFLSPAAIGSSPDSGIEFDRWNASS